MRAALYRAVSGAGADGLSHEVLAQRVFEALDLPVELYAVDPQVRFVARKETDRALREVLATRVITPAVDEPARRAVAPIGGFHRVPVVLRDRGSDERTRDRLD